jgi:hypothetical protein
LKFLKYKIDETLVPRLVKTIQNKHQLAETKGASYVIKELLKSSQQQEVKAELKSHLKSLKKSEDPGCKLIVELLNS